ncbi:MAG: DUF2298 domain-containing protein [Chloroflexi bacterium]|nr:DUF2298 domain-containing protein [Chloroflexota bacterium]
MQGLNHTSLRHKLTYPLLLIILLFGLTLRVWNVNFDHGIGSHPDERSTACFYAPRIHLPSSWDEFWDAKRSPLNPLWNVQENRREGFTYGHFPLYLGVATANVLHALAPVGVWLHAPEAATDLMTRADKDCSALAVAGRLVIAWLDTLTILLLFLLGRRVFSAGAGLLAATLYAFTAQAVQLSHFFAMDPASTTFTVLAVLGGVMMVQERTLRAAVLTGIGAGLAIASKFSALPILAVPVVAAFLAIWADVQHSQRTNQPGDGRARFAALLGAPLALCVAALAFFMTSPYAVLDWQSFLQATLVEQGRMVRGIADMPFTRQYRNTTPYLYFIEQQLRWGMGWPLGIIGALGTLFTLGMLLVSLYRLFYTWAAQSFGWAGRKWLSELELYNVVVWSWVLPYFGLTGAFMAKFNRYMSPLLPFVMLFAGGLIWRLWRVRESARATSRQGEPSQGDQESAITDELEVQHVAWGELSREAVAVAELPPRPGFATLMARSLALLLAIIGIGGGLFWSVAYVNGVYGHEHTWITASRWIYEHAPTGSVILWEQWDDPLPKTVPGEPGMDMGSKGLTNIDWGPYEEDTAEKYAILKDKLRTADYVAYSSKRIYGSVRELPERYPMTTRYYQAMWDGTLGFEMVLDQTSPPQLFGFKFQDRTADESWSLYDHPQATIFKKVRNLSDAEYDAIFDQVWETARPGYVGKGSALNPLLNVLGLGSTQESANHGLINRMIALVMQDDAAPEVESIDSRPSLMITKPLAALPVVDNYRWNQQASESVPLAIFWWWFVLALLGWAAWPLVFVIFKPLRDRGYLLSRLLGWLFGGWLLWWLASYGLALNTVVNSWLTVAVLLLCGLLVGIGQWSQIRLFLRENWPLLLAGEGLFALAYLFFVWIRMQNPDIWQPWFGGEKFMEFAFLNGILRSPTFPPVDPHFAGGFINYYYFGLYLVAYLIKLTGIYAEVAFNLAIPALFALTVVNAFSVAYSAHRVIFRERTLPARPTSAPSEPLATEETPLDLPKVAPLPVGRDWRSGFFAALLAPLFVVIIGNLDGFAQMVRDLAKLSDQNFQSAIGPVQALVNAFYGLQMLLAHKAAWPSYNFWDPSRVIPNTINEFPYWSFLFADLHAHLIGMPLAALFLGLALVLISDYAVDWRQAWLRGLAVLATFALLLGALASINLWELPTYFGLGVLAFLVSQYRGKGRINWLLTLLVTIGYIGGAYLFFQPFFHNYKNVSANGVGLVKAGDDLGTWLLIWGFLAFILISWLISAAAQPARSREVATPTVEEARPTGCERWLSLALRRFDRLPRLLYLHRLLVQPSTGYLFGLALLPLSLLMAAGSLLWQRSVLALCLLGLGLAILLLWRRGRQGDPGNLLVALLTATGLAVLAGTQVIYLKDFLQGGDWYRMNTLFKFFSQVWVIWGVAAAIAVPQIWRNFVAVYATPKFAKTRSAKRTEQPSPEFAESGLSPVLVKEKRVNWPLRVGWSTVFLLLLVVSLAYPIWGTPARLDQRFMGWRPAFGTLNGLDYMQQGVYTVPDTNTPIELKYDWAAIEWLLGHVRGNAVVVESADLEYYRAGGSRVASLTGLSGVSGMHEGEQRYGEDVGKRNDWLHEFWSTPDVGRMRQMLDELPIALIYAGQLEQDRHPDGVKKLEQLAATGVLTPIFRNERTVIYAVPGHLVQTTQGFYRPQ